MNPIPLEEIEAEIARRGLHARMIDVESPPKWFHAKQVEAWNSTKPIVAICAGWQSGKALDIATPIATADGFRLMRDIRPGDVVFGRDGKPCNVIGCSPVYMPSDVYLITFCDGTEMIADADHQWFAENWRQRRNRQRDELAGKLARGSFSAYGKVVTTRQMVERGTTGKDGGAEWSIPLPEAVKYDERKLPLDPYLLGAWLGDGHSCGASITSQDRQVIDRFESAGFPCVPNNSQNAGNATTYRIGNFTTVGRTRGRILDFNQRLKDLGVIGDKHIPEIYKLASVDQRLELLRGLLDTDGYCDPDGHIEFCSIREQLATDFAEVVRSLGIKCRVKVNRSAIYGKDCGLRYRVMLYTGIPLFTINAKLSRQKAPTRPDVFARYIRRIEKIEPRPVKCISVDSLDSLYLAGRDYVVTHNTTCLPPILIREIKRRGPGDYGAFSSTFPLLSRKFLPELKKALKGLAEYRSGDSQFIFTHEGSRRLWGLDWNGKDTVIQLGHAQNPDSLESATLKAVVWDEPGQRLVPEQSFLTVESRLMVNRGRMFLASRPYESGWFERMVSDGLKNPSGRVGVVSFPSWANPMNPPEHSERWDELRASMPRWKFTILYEGQFTRPLGLIYDCFDYDRDTCEDFEIPKTWNIYPGVDFGGVNMAGVLVAEDPHSMELYVISEYHSAAKRSFAEHVAEIKGRRNLSVGAGGSHQEDGWREAFRSAGLWLDEPPSNNVEVQIQCVYSQLAAHKLKFFRSGAERIIDDIGLFSREVDDNGDVTDKIANKSTWHRLDSLRYVVTKLRPPKDFEVTQPTVVQNVPRGTILSHATPTESRPWDLTGRFTK